MIKRNLYARGARHDNLADMIRSSRTTTRKRIQGNGEQPIDIHYIISEIEEAGLDPAKELSRVLGPDSDLDEETKLDALTQIVKWNKWRKLESEKIKQRQSKNSRANF